MNGTRAKSKWWGCRWFISLLPLAGVAATSPASGPAAAVPAKPPPKGPWSFSVGGAVKESYDSNVYLQDEPSGTPGLSEQSSMVTALTPSVGVTFKPSAAFQAALSYAPDVVFYHSESSEDHVAHRASLGFSGKPSPIEWSVNNTLLWIDGSDEGLIFLGPGGAPAAGGIPIRDRRDAAIFRNVSQLKYTVDPVFLRPSFAYYLHDFQTEQRTTPGYQNYADRSEISVGIDVGHAVSKSAALVVGYRFGHQSQEQLFTNPLEYSNDYHRLLFGFEGQPVSWAKFNISVGPDFRNFGDDVPATFDRDEILWYLDATITLMPGKRDTVVISGKQYEQPGFGGRSIYEDRTFSISWQHKFDSRFTAGAGFRAYNTDFQYPVLRDDWIFTPSALFSWNIRKGLSAEVSYTYDWAECDYPNTDAREFTRHLAAVGIKYVFSK